jgi:hypothetical protein
MIFAGVIKKFKNLLFRVTVSGESCWPSLVPGKTYLATSLLRASPGRFVVVENKRANCKFGQNFHCNPVTPKYIVKQVKNIERDSIRLNYKTPQITNFPSTPKTLTGE